MDIAKIESACRCAEKLIADSPRLYEAQIEDRARKLSARFGPVAASAAFAEIASDYRGDQSRLAERIADFILAHTPDDFCGLPD